MGNTFGATALSSYGGFWIALAITLTPGGFAIISTIEAEQGPSAFYDSFSFFIFVSNFPPASLLDFEKHSSPPPPLPAPVCFCLCPRPGPADLKTQPKRSFRVGSYSQRFSLLPRSAPPSHFSSSSSPSTSHSYCSGSDTCTGMPKGVQIHP